MAIKQICSLDKKKEPASEIPYVNTFSDVPEGEPLLYFNSLNCLSLAINMDSFADIHSVPYGNEWSITVTKAA